MTRYTIVAALLFLTIPLLAQQSAELEKRKGFKTIKLEMPVDSVKGVKFRKDIKEKIRKDEFDAKLYSVDHPDYAKIGEVEVHDIELKAYKNLIYEITVIAEKDPRLMKALESIYGKANYDQINETYYWNGSTLMMKFKSHSKNQLVMTYTSFAVHALMKQDKEKKVENIADDF